MSIKKCRPKKFEKKSYTNQDFIDEYKKLNDEWKKFSDMKDDLEKEYGKVNVNITDGTITPIEEEGDVKADT